MREWLKKARLEKGLTMKQVACLLHISESYYCSIEKGNRQKNMEITLAKNLSDILEIPFKVILLEESAIRRRL